MQKDYLGMRFGFSDTGSKMSFSVQGSERLLCVFISFLLAFSYSNLITNNINISATDELYATLREARLKHS